MGSDKLLISSWKEFADGIRNSTPIDTTETGSAKIARINRLQANPEEWFAYYFPKYSQKPDGTKSPPAQFHKDATVRVLNNPEWTEVRSWSRELAKSTRTMMEVMYLSLVGNPVNVGAGLAPAQLAKGKTRAKLPTANRQLPTIKYRRKQNILLISNSEDNATRLLAPYKVNFEANNRIINDYGKQENIGSWTDTEFITKSGVAFRALGAGQSPRGTRNEAIRPDVIIFDDLDTDIDCLNPDTIDKHWNWVQEAVIPTRSISNPLLVIWCGNIIAEDCCVKRAQERADHVDIINIRDAQGKSSWPEKNSEADIERVLSQISESARQKEYFNNPMTTGKTFANITWGKCPPLKEMQFVVCYSDPSPSNRDHPGAKSGLGNSRKASWIVGKQGRRYYVYFGFLDAVGARKFIEGIYACRDYVDNQCPAYFIIENNSLQDPIYTGIYLPLIYEIGAGSKKGVLGVTGDDRKKLDKWYRIEATLEPINSRGDLIFNQDEKGNEHMLRLVNEFKTAKITSKLLDGVDCIQGAVVELDEKSYIATPGAVITAKRTRSEKFY